MTAAGTGVAGHSISLMQDIGRCIIHEKVDPLVGGDFSKLNLTMGSTLFSIISILWT